MDTFLNYKGNHGPLVKGFTVMLRYILDDGGNIGGWWDRWAMLLKGEQVWGRRPSWGEVITLSVQGVFPSNILCIILLTLWHARALRYIFDRPNSRIIKKSGHHIYGSGFGVYLILSQRENIEHCSRMNPLSEYTSTVDDTFFFYGSNYLKRSDSKLISACLIVTPLHAVVQFFILWSIIFLKLLHALKILNDLYCWSTNTVCVLFKDFTLDLDF